MEILWWIFFPFLSQDDMHRNDVDDANVDDKPATYKMLNFSFHFFCFVSLPATLLYIFFGFKHISTFLILLLCIKMSFFSSSFGYAMRTSACSNKDVQVLVCQITIYTLYHYTLYPRSSNKLNSNLSHKERWRSDFSQKGSLNHHN